MRTEVSGAGRPKREGYMNVAPRPRRKYVERHEPKLGYLESRREPPRYATGKKERNGALKHPQNAKRQRRTSKNARKKAKNKTQKKKNQEQEQWPQR
jgi:hypothetical protein